MEKDKSNNPADTPKEENVGKTGDEFASSDGSEKETETKTEPKSEKVKLGEREFNSWEEAANAAEKSRNEAEKKMHTATTEAADLKAAQEAQTQTNAQKEQAEAVANAEAERLSTLAIENPVAYQNEIIKKATDNIARQQFQTNAPTYVAAARIKYTDYSDYEGEINKLLNTGIAQGYLMSYPAKCAGMTAVDVAYGLAKMPKMMSAQNTEQTAEQKRAGSDVPPSSGSTGVTVDDTKKDEELTEQEKAYARESHPELTPEKAYEHYKAGKKLPKPKS